MNSSNLIISKDAKIAFQYIENKDFLKLAKFVKQSHFNPFEICPNGLTIFESLLLESNKNFENIILMIIQKFHYSLKKMKHKRFLCFVEKDSIINTLLQYDCIQELDLFHTHHFFIYEKERKNIEMKINFLFSYFLSSASLETFDQILSILQNKKRISSKRKFSMHSIEPAYSLSCFYNLIDFSFIKLENEKELNLMDFIDKIIFLYFNFPFLRKNIEKYHNEIFSFLISNKKYLNTYTSFEQELHFENQIIFFLENIFSLKEIEQILQNKISHPLNPLWEKLILYFIEKNQFSFYLNPKNQTTNYFLFIQLSYSKIMDTFAKDLDIFEILYWNVTKKYESNTLIELKIIKGLLRDFSIFNWDNFYINYFFAQTPDLFLTLKIIKEHQTHLLDEILDSEIKNLTYRYIFHHDMISHSICLEKKQLKI
jgi:hypothetical protein